MPAAIPMIAFFACLVPMAAGAATPLAFKNAQLGMTLAEWRSLAPPEGAGPDVVAACADDPRVVTLAHNPLTVTLRASDAVSCGYVDLFGDTALPHSVLLDAHYRANDLRYLFVRGRPDPDPVHGIDRRLQRRFGHVRTTVRAAHSDDARAGAWP